MAIVPEDIDDKESAFGKQQQQQQQNPVVTANDAPISRSGFLTSMGAAAMTLATTTSSSSPVNAASAAVVVTAPTVGLAASTSQRQQQTGSIWEEVLSGMAAGASLVVTKTVVKYPLDTATVRLQMPGSSYSVYQPAELFRGCYRGMTAPLVSNIPAGAVFFAVKDATKTWLSNNSDIGPLPRWLTTSLAVGVAQFPYWLVRNPSEVVKTRQQAGVDGYGEHVPVWQAYRQVWMDANTTTTKPASSASVTAVASPLQAFYLGYFENILYAFPADVIKFIAYEQLSGGRKKDAMSPVEGALAGAAATAIAQLITTPLDVVRNRIMAQSSNTNETTKSPLSYWETLVQLGKEEGLEGLFAGTIPRVGKAALSGAIQFATYEETKKDVAKLFPRYTK